MSTLLSHEVKVSNMEAEMTWLVKYLFRLNNTWVGFEENIGDVNLCCLLFPFPFFLSFVFNPGSVCPSLGSISLCSQRCLWTLVLPYLYFQSAELADACPTSGSNVPSKSGCHSFPAYWRFKTIAQGFGRIENKQKAQNGVFEIEFVCGCSRLHISCLILSWKRLQCPWHHGVCILVWYIKM